jgi:hypothetical protein
MSLLFTASTTRLTISTFSCDIARAVSRVQCVMADVGLVTPAARTAGIGD